MDKETQDVLENILGQYTTKQQVRERYSQQERQQKAEFTTSFHEVRQQVIRVEMTEIGDYLKQQGHDYKVIDLDNIVDDDHPSRESEIGIALYLVPSGNGVSPNTNYTKFPYITFKTQAQEQWIAIAGNTAIQGGRGRDISYSGAKIDALSHETVRKNILKFVQDVFETLE